jgi:hypothetical protein
MEEWGIVVRHDNKHTHTREVSGGQRRPFTVVKEAPSQNKESRSQPLGK